MSPTAMIPIYLEYRCIFQKRLGKMKALRRRIMLCLVVGIHVLPTTESFLVSAASFRPIRGVFRSKLKAEQNENARTGNDENFDSIRKSLNRDFVSVACPAFVQQVAVPFADLVDSSFLSKLNPEALGGIGVARASQAAVSKIYTSALSKTTISFIASKYGASRSSGSEESKEELSSAVTTGLLLASIVGLLQLVVFSLFAAPILAGMGIPKTSAMAPSATSYMKARAFASPAATLWLVANGIFRGFGDTLTPLKCSILLNIANLLLDPVMIFRPLNLGASGAALATAIAQTVALIPLLAILQNRVKLNIRGQWSKLSDSIKQYVRAGSFIMMQTVARVAAFSYCSRQSALLGSVSASAYSVTFQIGFFITLMCESITVAVQTLLSRELADESQSLVLRRRIASHLVRTAVLSGVGLTFILSVIVFTGRFSIIQIFTKNAEVQQASYAAMPAFLVAQLVKGFSFPINGVMLGGMDWRFTMIITWLANAMCFVTLKVGSPGVSRIWLAWTAFYGMQAVCGFLRYAKRGGVWKKLGEK